MRILVEAWPITKDEFVLLSKSYKKNGPSVYWCGDVRMSTLRTHLDWYWNGNNLARFRSSHKRTMEHQRVEVFYSRQMDLWHNWRLSCSLFYFPFFLFTYRPCRSIRRVYGQLAVVQRLSRVQLLEIHQVKLGFDKFQIHPYLWRPSILRVSVTRTCTAYLDNWFSREDKVSSQKTSLNVEIGYSEMSMHSNVNCWLIFQAN